MTTKKRRAFNVRSAIEKEDELERALSLVLNPHTAATAAAAWRAEQTAELTKLTQAIDEALSKPDAEGADIFTAERLRRREAREAAVKHQLTVLKPTVVPTKASIVDELVALSPEACAHVASLTWEAKQLAEENARLKDENRLLRERLDEHRRTPASRPAAMVHPAFGGLRCPCGQGKCG